MLSKVKKSLRISNSFFDEEIQDLINAAKLDLQLCGIKKINEDDPLIIKAVIVYCKANFGLENSESEKFKKSYESLRNQLSLAGEYNNVERSN